jgi:methionyl-tRNA formyltransferase
MNYLLFANPVTGSPVLKSLIKRQPPAVVVTFFRHRDTWRNLLYRFMAGKLTVEDRCRLYYKIPFYDYHMLNVSRMKAIIREHQIEMGFIATFSSIIPQKLATLFPKGLYNLHPSLLPGHAGVHPFFWIIYHQEEYSGTSCHQATEKLDGGGIILQTKYAIHGMDSKKLFSFYCYDCSRIIAEVTSRHDSLSSLKTNGHEAIFDPPVIPSDDNLKKVATSPEIKDQINRALRLYGRRI